MLTFLKRSAALMLLTCAAVMSTSAVADGYGHGKFNATPNKYVGTYYGANPATLNTLHSDGTYSEVFSDMFTEDPNTTQMGAKTTPSHGSWRRIGPNRVRTTSLFFATEPLGHNYRPGGFIGKITSELVFDKPVKGKSPGYNSMNTIVEIFFPDQDPLSDEPIVVIPIEGGRWTRVYTQ